MYRQSIGHAFFVRIQRIIFLAAAGTTTFSLGPLFAATDTTADVPATLQFTVDDIKGQPTELAQYQGKTVLVVNVASKCGLTPQYKELQALQDKYADKGLVVLAFPCNQFGQQEPGTHDEIQQFCQSKYHVTFPLFAKIDVNGPDAAPLYKHLTALDAKPKGAGDVNWNFEKFLIGRSGQVLGRFSPRTRPSDQELVGAIEADLATE